MNMVIRFALWISTACASLGIDVLTKAAPHDLVIDNHSRTPGIALIFVGASLVALALWHSNAMAIGAGFMFGGLCGNGGQVLLFGYASDWIPLGGWLTNVADISGAVGLAWCFAGCAHTALSAQRPAASGRQLVLATPSLHVRDKAQREEA